MAGIWPVKTWADGEIPNKTNLNEVGNKLTDLDQHGHTGADGDGSENINPDTVTLDDISEPSAPGANKVLVYSASETAKVRAGAAGSSIAISLATHTHTQGAGAGNDSVLATGAVVELTSVSYTGTITQAQTPSDSTGSSQYAIFHAGYGAVRNVTGNTGTYHIRLLKDSVQQVETSVAVSTVVDQQGSVVEDTTYIALANASTNFQIEHKKSGTASLHAVHGYGTIVREIQCL